MYQVIKMYGDFEPWWLLEGWQDDVIMCDIFDNYQDALRFFKEEQKKLSQTLSQSEEKSGAMATFWDPDDQRWCEECDEYLQQYHSLFILDQAKGAKMVTVGNVPRRLHSRGPKQCKIKPRTI